MKKYFSSLTDWLNYSLDIIPKIREVVEVIEVGMTSVERRNNELKVKHKVLKYLLKFT